MQTRGPVTKAWGTFVVKYASRYFFSFFSFGEATKTLARERANNVAIKEPVYTALIRHSLFIEDYFGSDDFLSGFTRIFIENVEIIWAYRRVT